MTALGLITTASQQYQQLQAEPPAGAPALNMNIGGTGGAGSGVIIGRSISTVQLWTDLSAASPVPGNPNGSIDIRPLGEPGLCLTVPGGNYHSGVQLQVQACDGNVDQEFQDFSAGGGGRGLVPFAAKQLCLQAGASILQGEPVTLQACAPPTNLTANDNWHAYYAGWDGWGGFTNLVPPALRS